MKEPRDYQKEALRELKRATSGLLADGLGLGKTLVGVERVRGLILKSPPRVLVVAPLNTHYGWQSHFQGQFPTLAENSDMVRICGTSKADPESWEAMRRGEPGVFIIGWEAMRGSGDIKVTKALWKKTGTWDLIIADEVHRIQNQKSRTKEVLRNIKTRYKLALSGTPAGNKPEGLWSVLNWLWPDSYTSYWSWVYTHMNVEDQYAHGRSFKKITGEKNSGAIFQTLPCVVRRRPEDVFDQLPEVSVHTVKVPMTKIQHKIYRDFEDQAFAWLKGEPVATPLPLTQRLRLRQTALCEPSAVYEEETGEQTVYFHKDSFAPKIKALKEILEDLPADEPVLVFTHSRKFADVVYAQLTRDKSVQWKIDLWTGGTPQKRRREILAEFSRAQGPRVLIAVISAIGEGTDGLQNSCANEVWMSQDDNGLMNTQAEGRLNRSGQERMINRWYIQTEGTIDEGVYERLSDNKIKMGKFYRDIE